MVAEMTKRIIRPPKHEFDCFDFRRGATVESKFYGYILCARRIAPSDRNRSRGGHQAADYSMCRPG
jgi:hypothetical protein